MKYLLLLLILSTCYARASEPLRVATFFNKNTCQLVWSIRNSTNKAIELTNGQLPWSDGIAGAELTVSASGKSIPQKYFSIERYFGYTRIHALSTKVQKVSVKSTFRQWVLPMDDIDVKWIYKLSLTESRYEFSGAFSVPKECLR